MKQQLHSSVDRLLSPTLQTRIVQDFLTHSCHVPIAILILELLLSPGSYFFKPDGFLLIISALLQSLYLSRHEAIDNPSPFIGNLIGPLAYSVVEFTLEGPEFFEQSQHWAYTYYGLTFAGLQSLRHRFPGFSNPVILFESVIRASIPVVMYALFEQRTGAHFLVFFDDQAHLFLTIVLVLLGGLLGFAQISLLAYQSALKSLARKLHQFSTWGLGSNLVRGALHNPKDLEQSRKTRAVFFMDVRGFTAWSELRQPETVVEMLQSYYAEAEKLLMNFGAIRIKFTADEVMAVFAAEADSFHAARDTLQGSNLILDEYGLTAGAGLHIGPVIEGMLGTDDLKAYEVIGDTVNTASRACSEAAPGILLCTFEVARPANTQSLKTIEVNVKGKKLPVHLWAS